MEERRKNCSVIYLKDSNLPNLDRPGVVQSFFPTQIFRSLFNDLFSSMNRSAEFIDIRADYLRLRVHTLASLVSLLLILWIPIDFITVETEIAIKLAWLRIAVAVVTSAIARVTNSDQNQALSHVQIMLAWLILAMNVFMLAAHLLLLNSTSREAIFGYSLFPYLFIATLSIFPLTAVEGLRLSGITLLFVAGKHLIHGNLQTFIALSEFWFLILLAIVVLWSELGQLQMLLHLFRQATRDTLTGLFNRARLLTNITRFKDQTDQRSNDSLLAVMMFDLDNFKQINDTYGHIAGDDVLICFATLLNNSLRSTDVAGRYGGEEFVAVLTGIDVEQARKIAERIRRKCEDTLVQTRNGKEIRFTTSVGVVFYRKGEDISILLDRADKNLYQAKIEGRNRVVLTTPQSNRFDQRAWQIV